MVGSPFAVPLFPAGDNCLRDKSGITVLNGAMGVDKNEERIELLICIYIYIYIYIYAGPYTRTSSKAPGR